MFVDDGVLMFQSATVPFSSDCLCPCTVQVVRAILASDPETTEKAASVAAGGAFGPGVDSVSVKIVMKRLSRGLMRGARPLERASGSAGGRGSASKASAAAAKGRGSTAAAVAGPAKTGERGRGVLPAVQCIS